MTVSVIPPEVIDELMKARQLSREELLAELGLIPVSFPKPSETENPDV